MWTKLDDGLIDHRKVFLAAEGLGRNGPALVIGMYAIGLLWSNKQLTDGFLPLGMVKTLRHFERPITIANRLVAASLWESATDGYQIHDYHEYNPTAVDARARRDHIRTARSNAGTNGARVRWNYHK